MELEYFNSICTVFRWNEIVLSYKWIPLKKTNEIMDTLYSN